MEPPQRARSSDWSNDEPRLRYHAPSRLNKVRVPPSGIELFFLELPQLTAEPVPHLGLEAKLGQQRLAFRPEAGGGGMVLCGFGGRFRRLPVEVAPAVAAAFGLGGQPG